jgi:hypothetical protein
VSVKVNGFTVGNVTGSGGGEMDQTLPVPAADFVEGTNTVTIQSSGYSGDFDYTDRVTLSYPHQFLADANSLAFGVTGGQSVAVGGFTTSDIRVLDVTNPLSPRELTASITGSGSSWQATVKPPADATRLYAFTAATTAGPKAIQLDQASNLKGVGNGANLVIVAYGDFLSAANTLATFRRSTAGGGYVVQVADVQDVYDEFSDGAHSPHAITSFLQWASTHWSPAPHYVLLVGDATFDPRNYRQDGTSPGGLDWDLVPTIFVDTHLGTDDREIPSDDTLADFNGDGVPEMAVGRLPVRTASDASAVVAKITGYEQDPVPAPASRVAALVDDNPIDYSFASFSADLRDNVLVPGGIPNDAAHMKQIHRTDGPTDADVHNAVLAAANTGPTIVNFFGHGLTRDWTSGPIFTASDAAGLTNSKLSLYLMMTCLNGYFLEPNAATSSSMAESLLLAPHAAVAAWASTASTFPSDQVNADKLATQEALAGTTLGQAMIDAKTSITDLDVKHSWTLMGDPTTTLR